MVVTTLPLPFSGTFNAKFLHESLPLLLASHLVTGSIERHPKLLGPIDAVVGFIRLK